MVNYNSCCFINNEKKIFMCLSVICGFLIPLDQLLTVALCVTELNKKSFFLSLNYEILYLKHHLKGIWKPNRCVSIKKLFSFNPLLLVLCILS